MTPQTAGLRAVTVLLSMAPEAELFITQMRQRTQ